MSSKINKKLHQEMYKLMPFETFKENDNRYSRLADTMFESESYKRLSINAKGLYSYIKHKKYKGIKYEKIINKPNWKDRESDYFTFAEIEQEKAVEYLHICPKTQKKALKELLDNGFIEKIPFSTKNGKNFNSANQKYEATKYKFSNKWYSEK